MKNRLTKGDNAPSFTTKDITGNSISLLPANKWIFLSFHRFAACPFCTLRTHELIKNHSRFKELNIEIISIWPSTTTNMQKFIGRETAPFPMVADPGKEIFKKYKVMKSDFFGMFSTLVHPKMVFAALKVRYKDQVIDSDPNLFPADFLIQPDGKIALAHYGKHFGDHIPIEQLLYHAAHSKQAIEPSFNKTN